MNILPILIANTTMQNTMTQANCINSSFHHHCCNNNSDNEIKTETDEEKLQRLKAKAKYIPKHLTDQELLEYLEHKEKDDLDLLSI